MTVSTTRRRWLLAPALLAAVSMLAVGCATGNSSLADNIGAAGAHSPAATSKTATPTSAKPSTANISEATAPKVAANDTSTAAQSIKPGQMVAGEPTTPMTANTPKTEVSDIPPAPGGTASFSYTAKIEVSPMHTTAIHAGCPAGWYVRPGTPGYYTDTDPDASFSYTDETWVFYVENDDSISGTLPHPNGGDIFSNLSVSFYNSSMIHSHGASITYWCDAVPSWYSNASAQAGADAAAMSPTTAQKRQTNTSPTASAAGLGQIGPVPPSCWYCAKNEQLVNLATGDALDPSTASVGDAVQVNPVTNSSSQNIYLQGQSGGSVFMNGLATFGLWQEATYLNTAVGVSGISAAWASASSEPPAGGRFYYVDQGAGSVKGATQLISTDTNLCLADANGQAAMAPCDATDETQWWVVNEAL